MRKEPARVWGGEWRLRGILILALGVSACAHHVATFPHSAPMPGQSARCELLAPPPTAATSLHITVTDAISPGDAPLPRTDAERAIFPLLYAPSPRAGANCHDSSGSTLAASPAAARQDTARIPVAPARSGPADVWPATTGRYELAAAVDTALDLVPRQSTSGPTLHVSRIPADDGRDALDDGTDVLITSDATTIAYAEARPDFISVPLPWSRAYVLVQPDATAPTDSTALRALQDDLATDAVRVEARGIDATQWADAVATCDTGATNSVGPADASPEPGAPGAPSRGAASLAGRIVYARDDAAARALSERLVALANVRDPRLATLAPALTARAPVRATGFEATQLREALAVGHEAAYVTSMHVSEMCRDVATLISEAPWVGRDARGLREVITPLIETRPRAIVRRGRAGVAVDDAGGVYLEFGPATGS